MCEWAERYTTRSDPERQTQTKSPPSLFIFGPIRTSGEMYARQHPDGPLSHLWVLQASIVGRILRTLHGIIPTADIRARTEQNESKHANR
jgi:hypothetical protein